jgi:hypothetical protein
MRAGMLSLNGLKRSAKTNLVEEGIWLIRKIAAAQSNLFGIRKRWRCSSNYRDEYCIIHKATCNVVLAPDRSTSASHRRPIGYQPTCRRNMTPTLTLKQQRDSRPYHIAPLARLPIVSATG